MRLDVGVNGLLFVVWALVLLGGNGISAVVTVPTIISSYMVLQRAPQSAVLWGESNPAVDGPITIILDGNSWWNASVSSSGSWRVELEPQPTTPPGVQHTITIVGNQNNITLFGVLFGDVWLCGGQSNMEFTLSDSLNGSYHIKQSALFTGIRYFTLNKTISHIPLSNESSKDPSHLWGISGPDVVGGPSWTEFSATCYFFGTHLYQALQSEVPLGLVSSNWCGTAIELWSSPDALAACDKSAAEKERAMNPNPNINMKEIQECQPAGVIDSDLYNGMIAPLLNMQFFGVVWYQGEQNSFAPEAYACQFPAMIEDWRIKFAQPHLYFYFVMLSPFPGENTLAPIREAQLSALVLPHTGMASAIDLGDPDAPLGPYHPRNKEEVGRRLFLSAWSDAYGHDVVSTGPLLTHIDYPGTGSSPDNHTFVIHYAPGPTAQGLTLRNTQSCTMCCKQAPAFQIQQADGTWNYGIVTVFPSSSRVLVSLSSLSSWNPALGLSYAYMDYPECVLSNTATLPATPFQQHYNPWKQTQEQP